MWKSLRAVLRSPSGHATAADNERRNEQGQHSWYRWTTTDPQTGGATLDIDGWIGEPGPSGPALIDEITSVRPDPFLVRLHSPGGTGVSGFQLYWFLKPCPTLTVHIAGLAGSTAAFLALSGRRVTMVRDGWLVVHAPRGFLSGGPFTAAQLRAAAAEMDKLNEQQIKILRERSGASDRVVRRWLEEPGTAFTATEALEAGLIDAIVDEPALPIRPEWKMIAGEYRAPTRDGTPRRRLEVSCAA